jgi:hypothetical protein
MRTVWRGLVNFGMFWYRFIVGDDWTVAAVVAAGLGVTALLRVWWVMPPLVIAILGLSVRRARRA